MKCYVCGKVGPDKFSKAAQSWDWFHGYLDETVHFCPAHQDSEERRKLWILSRVKPEAEKSWDEGL